MAGIGTALANAEGLQNRLLQKFGELKRPVISKSKSAQEVEDEERGLQSMQERLSTLENKLRVFRDLDNGKADERANVMTALDVARRELLAAAREFEAYSFGSKDVIRSIMEFCQLKQAQADATPRSFKSTFKSGAPPKRDVQPQQHADQNEQPSARPHPAGSSASSLPGGMDQSTPSVTVAPTPSHLSSASKRYPPPTKNEQAQPPQPQPPQPHLSSRLPRFPADTGNNTANDNGNNSNNNGSRSSGSSGISVAATAAAFSGPSGAVAPGLQRPKPGSLNIRVPSSGLSCTRTSNATSATSSAANSANNNSISNSAHSAAAANNVRASNNSSSGGEPVSAAPADVAAAATAMAGGAANSARGSTSSSLSRASSLPKAPGVFPRPTTVAQPANPPSPSQQAAPATDGAAAAAAASQPHLPSTPPPTTMAGGQSPHASSPSPRVDGPPLSDHSPQVTQDSSMCNMESVCGAGTYPGAGGHSTTPTNPSAAAVGEPSARLKALTQLHGQDTASSIPAPPPAAPQRPRMLDAYMAAAGSSSPNHQQQRQDLLQDQRESELTLGHVFAKPSAVAATGSLRPSHQLQRAHTSATPDAASSSSGTHSTTPSAASSLSLPAPHAAAAAAHAATPEMSNKGSKSYTAPDVGAGALGPRSGSVTTAVALKPAPVSARPEPSPQEEEVEGSSSTTPGPHRTTTTDHPRTAHSGVADVRMLSPALSSTYSSSDFSPNKQQGGVSRAGAGSESAYKGRPGAAMQEAEQEPIVVADSPKLFPNDDGKSIERRKRAEATAAALFAAKRSTDSVGAAAPTTPAAQPPGSSHVAKLQQRFLQTSQQQRQQQRELAPTACTNSVLGMLRSSGQHQQQGHRKQSKEDSDEGVVRDESVSFEGARREMEAEGAIEGGGEACWEVEAQRTTARAPPPARAQQLDRSSSAAAVNMHPAHTMHLQTPSSRMNSTAADRQLAPSQQSQAGGGAAVPADSHPAMPAAQHLGPLQRDSMPTAAAAVVEEAAPAEQQHHRAAAAAAGAANPGRSGGGGSRAAGTGVPPPSVLAAGPQLVAAGLISVPPVFARERPATHVCEAWEMEGKASRPAMRACEGWETEGEEDEGVQEQQALMQRQALEAYLLHQHAQYGSVDDLDAATYSRRHTAPDPAMMEHLQQQLRVGAVHGVPALSRGPSYYAGGGRKKKRGVWGGVLRMLGITTTVASVVVATGAAVFAAAALNTGLDELDLMHPEASMPIKNGSRGPFKSKVQRAKCPQGSSMRHPDALAAGRG